MSTEGNKALLRLWYDEVWNQRNLDAFDQFVAPGYAHHDEPCATIAGA